MGFFTLTSPRFKPIAKALGVVLICGVIGIIYAAWRAAVEFETPLIVLRGEIQSPDGAYVASWFEVEPPATDPYLTEVNLRRSVDKFNSEDDIVLNLKWKYPIRLEWKGTRMLVVTFNCPEKYVLYRRQGWRDVQVTFDNTVRGLAQTSGL